MIYIYIYIYITYKYIYVYIYIYLYIYIYSSGKGSLLALQRVLNDFWEPERWYIQRTDEENTIYLLLRVSCYQSSAKQIT